MSRLEWHVAAITDKGRKRSDNQDNFYVSPDQRVFVVADGMGGERGGATASRLAVEAFQQCFDKEKPHANDAEKIYQWLVDAVLIANRSVWATSETDATVGGMGTTIVAAVQADDGQLYIAHVGDSRAYKISPDSTCATVLTQDHSVVMELYLQGKISAEQFRTSPFKNYITRCLGHHDSVDVDKTLVTVEPGDAIILCTDGLSGVLSDERIAEIVHAGHDAGGARDVLLAETLEGGAPDNVTIILVTYEAAAARHEQFAGKEKSKGSA